MAAGMSPSKVASGAGHDEHGTKLSKMIIGIGPGSAGASGGGAAAGKVESYATASQVSVEIFVAGNGVDYPKPGQKATIHYTAFRADGEFFDSTRARGRPFTFGLGEEQVIPGLEEAVVCLSVGERAKATIPAAKAYGAKGFPGKVPPMMDLHFDLELLSLE